MAQILYIHGIGNHGPAEPLKRVGKQPAESADLNMYTRRFGQILRSDGNPGNFVDEALVVNAHMRNAGI